jgi:hypothetical protein
MTTTTADPTRPHASLDPQRDENWGTPCKTEAQLFANLDRLGEIVAIGPCKVLSYDSQGNLVEEYWTAGTPAWRRLVAAVFLAGLLAKGEPNE